MSLSQQPRTNQFYYDVDLPFDRDGFLTIEMPSLFKTLGYSKAEYDRLKGSIKIKDTRLCKDPHYYEWYWRPIKETELLEPSDVIKFGKFKYLRVCMAKQNLVTRLRWALQRWLDKVRG